MVVRLGSSDKQDVVNHSTGTASTIGRSTSALTMFMSGAFGSR